MMGVTCDGRHSCRDGQALDHEIWQKQKKTRRDFCLLISLFLSLSFPIAERVQEKGLSNSNAESG
jgi:hypothetical protein